MPGRPDLGVDTRNSKPRPAMPGGVWPVAHTLTANNAAMLTLSVRGTRNTPIARAFSASLSARHRYARGLGQPGAPPGDGVDGADVTAGALLVFGHRLPVDVGDPQVPGGVHRDAKRI